jgi:hypothetical protein
MIYTTHIVPRTTTHISNGTHLLTNTTVFHRHSSLQPWRWHRYWHRHHCTGTVITVLAPSSTLAFIYNRVFGSTLPQRLAHARGVPLLSVLVHWGAGLMFVLVAGFVMRELRRVIREDLLKVGTSVVIFEVYLMEV